MGLNLEYLLEKKKCQMGCVCMYRLVSFSSPSSLNLSHGQNKIKGGIIIIIDKRNTLPLTRQLIYEEQTKPRNVALNKIKERVPKSKYSIGFSVNTLRHSYVGW